METVVAFNNELSGLYDSRPPISKAKMAAITKSAMRAIKFYKHVVQSVEKFILKCKPEYKVPGLYVIDSIVRQSRHQYGTEKDVFAPRFQRNLKETFANLFRCAPEDKSRIIRVLNLWQKNNVFKSDVIQPIFDLADPNHPIYHQMPPLGSGSGNVGAGGPSGSGSLSLADISTGSNGLNSSNLDLSMGGAHGGDDKLGGMPDLSLSSSRSGLHDNLGVGSSSSSRRHLEQHYMKRSASSSNSKSSRGCFDGAKSHHHQKYGKSSHELDYDVREIIDDEHDDMMGDDHHCLGDDSPPTSSNLLDNNNLKQLLNDPNVLRQLQTLQNFQKFKAQEENQKLRYQDEALQQHLQSVLKGTAGMPPGLGLGMSLNDVADMNKDVEFVSEQQSIEVINLDGGDSRSPTPERERYKRSRRSSRSRSRSRDRGGRGGGGAGGGGGGAERDRERGSRRRGSRSRSRSRSPRSSRRRSSRDRDREQRLERSTRDKERDREHDRERRKKGLPDIKKEHLSVCSTTLWVGHLSKLVYQEELSDTFGEYGDIVSIDQIVPRGCAFIVMNRRQDAHKAMQALKSHKLQGRAITISWAAGKGVKSKEWKDFWDLELGVTYIPWSKLSLDTDLDSLEEGGMFDEDTMPGWLKDKINQVKNNKDNKGGVINLPPGSELGNALPNAGPPALLFGIDTTQPPPGAPPGGPPALMGMVPGQYSMAPPPRMLGPMGAMNPMAGLSMPPNMVPGMPPPMMMPPGMMPPGFPGMGGPSHPLGLPPGAQFPPPGAVPPPMVSGGGGGGGNVSSDDQMDIEMELEDAPAAPLPLSQPQPPNYNQPPPMFAAGAAAAANNVEAAVAAAASEMLQRARGAGSRWGGRDDVGEAAFNGGAFNEARAPHFNPMELAAMQQQRPDFMGVDFDNRAGARGLGARAGNHNGGADFFAPNMNQSRFNQPTSLMQMRIPPPVAFNQRMGGPGAGNGGGAGGGAGGAGGPGGPMFMRNQGGGGGGNGGGGAPGGRQQGPGFYNPRNPFNDQRARGGGRGMGGGGAAGAAGRGGRWSDEEEEGSFNKRRGAAAGAGAGAGNRFRERGGENATAEERRAGQARGGRGGSRDERERGPRRGSRDDSSRNSISSTDENKPASTATTATATETLENNNKDSQPTATVIATTTTTKSSTDTEEDWDRELQEYDARMEAQAAAAAAAAALESTQNSTAAEEEEATPALEAERAESFVKPAAEASEVTTKPPSPACTPLYDELPPPAQPSQQPLEIRAATPPVESPTQPEAEPEVEVAPTPVEAAEPARVVAEEEAEEEENVEQEEQ